MELREGLRAELGPLFRINHLNDGSADIVSPLLYPDGKSVTITMPATLLPDGMLWLTDSGRTTLWLQEVIPGRDLLREDPEFVLQVNDLARTHSVQLRGYVIECVLPVRVCNEEPSLCARQIVRIAQASAEVARLGNCFRRLRQLG